MTPPRRFRADPARTRRMALPLRIASGMRAIDEGLVEEIGRRMMTRDEVGHALAAAMGRGADDPERVTMRHVEEALAAGGPTATSPTALRSFFEAVAPDPSWLDRDLLEQGARAYRRLGRSRDDVLLCLGLIGGYRYGGPTELLVRTGGLTGDGAMRRLGETQAWTHHISRPGGLLPGGQGWRSTLHVRIMHALVASRYERPGRFDVAGHGLPINQADSAATLGLFSGAVLLGVRALGRPVPRADSRAIMHLWRYLGWLLGVYEDWLQESEREQHHFNAHIVLAQGPITPNGAELSRPLIEGLRTERGRHRVRGWWERERALSITSLLVGPRSMVELGLPPRLPWTLPGHVGRNLLEGVVLARSERGRRWLEDASDRRYERDMHRRLGSRPHGPRALP